MKEEYKYIHFEEGATFTGDRSKPPWYCYNTKSADELGVVEWYPRWRKWTFRANNEEVVFSDDCLDDISHFMKQLPKHLTPASCPE